jgi:hypothetical protein
MAYPPNRILKVSQVVRLTKFLYAVVMAVVANDYLILSMLSEARIKALSKRTHSVTVLLKGRNTNRNRL